MPEYDGGAPAARGSAAQDGPERGGPRRGGPKQAAAEQGSAEQGSAEQGSAEQGSAEQGSAEQGSAEQVRNPSGWDAAVPWAEPFGTGSPERARLATAFGAAVRKTGSLMQLVGQAAADRIGINATDLNCLNILSFSGQMTAGELARATGLTTASITGVVDRLEEAGYVRRERDVRDRRRVVVHLVLDRAIRDVAPLFLPMVREWQEMAHQYSDDELRLIVEFYGQMEEVFRRHVVRLREPADPGPSPADPGPPAPEPGPAPAEPGAGA
jgi:DNA-binding MarR family transcriptional regulator